jgi:maleamate amidohydrolase
MRPWEEIIPERDRQIYARSGMGTRQQIGRQPALLVIDVVESFTGSKPADVAESQQESRLSCGASAWDAMPHIRTMLDFCRAGKIPVIYAVGDPEYKEICGSSTKGYSSGEAIKLHTTNIPELVAPIPGEFVIRKTKASIFFLTPLLIYLHKHGIDTLFITGTTTSGCIRASAIDSFSYGFRTIVVEECCFDRSEFSHLVNLYEMNCKYADVIQVDEALAMLSAFTDEAKTGV